MINRTVIKLSGEALSGDGTHSFDDSVIDSIVGQIKTVLSKGTQVALVVGGGNFWRGRQSATGMDRVKSDQIGMLATVMNAIYLTESFKRQGVSAMVMTPFPIQSMTTPYERDTALRFMAAQTVVINAAGLGHPLFSTDTITALRAAELSADMVLYAKNVDGVYNKDPKKHTDARKYQKLSYQTAIKENLNAADLTALHLSGEAGIPSLVFGLDEPDSIIRACAYPALDGLQATLLDVHVQDEWQ